MKDESQYTPKSMNQSRVWSAEGKINHSGEYHWSFKPKKIRMSEPVVWTSKTKEYTKTIYKQFIK